MTPTPRGVSGAADGVPLWHEDRGERANRRRKPLPGSTEADVAIVGAGFTGLWAPYYLLQADPSLKVVLLEREFTGFGASGRNGGWASSIFPVSLARVEQLYSHHAAPDLQAAMNETVTEIGRVVEHEGIDFDYARDGFVSLARSQAQWARAKATVSGVVEGIFTEHCALLHPDKLVRGLAGWVEEHGAVIYEDTAVDE
ncbi:NAD(P)/FAD-dependent oxidoreductase, partial [Rhodococcus koreensis]